MGTVCLFVCLFVCVFLCVSRITHERVHGCRPNTVVVGEGRGVGEGRPSRSDSMLVVLRIRITVPLDLTLRHTAWYDILSLDRGRHRASPWQCIGLGRVCAFWTHLHCVSEKQHVTTFLMISWTITARLQIFLAHILLRLWAIDRYF